jgi:predicted HD superfamily hydrolase involved in NAD metabolism
MTTRTKKKQSATKTKSGRKKTILKKVTLKKVVTGSTRTGTIKLKVVRKKPEGIPEKMTLRKALLYAEPRVTKKRFLHILGVAKVGDELAKLAGVNRFLVGLACLLHDSCKEMKDSELLSQAKKGRLKLSAIDKKNGHLLHGPVAALTIKKELKISNKEVLNAIREHTLGAVGMTDISKVVFLADCLEPGRPADFTQPIWQALKEPVPIGSGRCKINLDNAMLVACDLSLAHLLSARRSIHPRTVDVRNHFLGIVRAAQKASS